MWTLVEKSEENQLFLSAPSRSRADHRVGLVIANNSMFVGLLLIDRNIALPRCPEEQPLPRVRVLPPEDAASTPPVVPPQPIEEVMMERKRLEEQGETSPKAPRA